MIYVLVYEYDVYLKLKYLYNEYPHIKSIYINLLIKCIHYNFIFRMNIQQLEQLVEDNKFNIKLLNQQKVSQLRITYPILYVNEYRGRPPYIDCSDGGVYTSKEEAKKNIVYNTVNHYFMKTTIISVDDVCDYILLHNLNKPSENFRDD